MTTDQSNVAPFSEAEPMPEHEPAGEAVGARHHHPNGEHATPVGVYVGHSLDMPHLIFIDWSAPTQDGANSGLFTINLTKNILVRTRPHPTMSGVRNVCVTCGNEDVAAMEVTRAAAGELHHDVWSAVSNARSNYTLHYSSHRAQAAVRRSSAQKRIAQPSTGTNTDTGEPAASEPAESKPGAKRTHPGVAVAAGVIGYLTLMAAGAGLYFSEAGPAALSFSETGAVSENTAPAALESHSTDGPRTDASSADNNDNSMWSPE